MSILNCWVTPEMALVGVDSLAGALDGVQRSMDKMMILPHINAVIAIRGTAGFLPTLYGAAMVVGTFDGLLEAFAGGMDQIYQRGFCTTLKAMGANPADHVKQTVIAAGWSVSAGRFIGREWTQDGPDLGFIEEEIAPHSIGPWDPSIDTLTKDVSNVPAMVTLARAQLRLLREKAPGAAGGGNFYMARLTKDATMVAKVAELR